MSHRRMKRWKATHLPARPLPSLGDSEPPAPRRRSDTAKPLAGAVARLRLHQPPKTEPETELPPAPPAA